MTTPTAETPRAIQTAADKLAQICADTRTEVARRRAVTSLEAIRAKAFAADPPRGFSHALMERTNAGGVGLIAEIKKASPSAGLIRPDFDPAALARAYEEGGASCLSVLTDAQYFQGSTEDLKTVRAASSLPLLRKDFILEPWQVYESRALGADCILVILAAVTDEEALELEAVARELDMDVLAEVHEAAELQRALGLQTKLIGINNRNLKTLQTSISIAIELAPNVPPDRFLIAESGIRTHDDITQLLAAGMNCFLVGESLMRQPDVTAAVRKLLNG
jgi:indole-3-glycerol phosphate synthase